jgi:mannosyl-3-phosphoglycerate synthase
MNIDTVQFSHILETGDLQNLHFFLSRTAFVISHKDEKVKTLHEVLWYLPLNSPIIIVTNCQESEKENLKHELKMELTHHQKIYLVHQKDETIARLFEAYGVCQILGKDGNVIDGKGEGMYIGALCAYQLGYPRWIIFYDADNFVPSALLEYTLAMSRLFMSSPYSALAPEHYPSNGVMLNTANFLNAEHDTSNGVMLNAANYLDSERDTTNGVMLNAAKHLDVDLHNVRICWSSKPELKNGHLDTRIMGRCTRVVSPLFNELLEGWFGMRNNEISSSNAGEQGMTVKTALSLRFSSGYSIESFQLLDLLFHAYKRNGSARSITLQQYLSKSPHFHDKKGDDHIKKMIEYSLGSFFHFRESLPGNVKRKLRMVYAELGLNFVVPLLYPSLQDLQLKRIEGFMDQYLLGAKADYQDVLVAELEG